MNQVLLYSFTGVLLFVLGLHGIISIGHVLRKILASSIMAGGVFLLLIAIAARNTFEFPDPLPKAMLLTGLVVSLSAMAFATTLACRLRSLTGASQLDHKESEQGDAH